MSDLWQHVVGVPLAAWMAADTPEKLAELLDRRDHPRRCTVEHRDDVGIYSFGGTLIRTARTEPCNGYHNTPQTPAI